MTRKTCGKVTEQNEMFMALIEQKGEQKCEQKCEQKGEQKGEVKS